MDQNSIEEIRESGPVAYEDLCRYHSFAQILGNKDNEYSEEERRRRWQKVMGLGKDMAGYWSDITACIDCMHLNEEEAWCNSVGMPCTVNPITSFQLGTLGMACMGLGYQKAEPELFDSVFEPF